MFTLARNYLKSVANTIGVNDVRFRQGSHKSKREIRIFTMPTRGNLAQDFTLQKELARQGIKDYVDPHDTYPARPIAVTKTDATGNAGFTVKATGAKFVTNGVVADDYLIFDKSNLRSKIGTVVDEDTLLLSDVDITGNELDFHIGPKDGHPQVRGRILKAIQKLSFVVQFTHRKPELAEVDFLNFQRYIGKFIYDGQFAEYVRETDRQNIVDSKGNKVAVNLGRYEILDNKSYGELENAYVQEVEFVGGIFMIPDPYLSQLELAADWVAPKASVAPPEPASLEFDEVHNSQYIPLI